jgi:hypothetical protein
VAVATADSTGAFMVVAVATADLSTCSGFLVRYVRDPLRNLVRERPTEKFGT